MECSGNMIGTDELYESLWDTPCLVCEKSEAFVLGSFRPKYKQWFRREKGDSRTMLYSVQTVL